MSNAPFIPAATAKKLTEEIPKGQRHQAAMEIAIPLLGNGLSPSAVYQTLRDKFPADVTDSELENVVRWAQGKNPTPSGFGPQARPTNGFRRSFAPAPKSVTITPLEKANWWLCGLELSQDKIKELSPVSVPETNRDCCRTLFEVLYKDTDQVNIVCDYIQEEQKARPTGGGKTLTSREWQDWISGKGVPQSNAGAWIRPNPCGTGTGASGAITDSDIQDFRFLLVESDTLPLATQLALYSKLNLTISAMLLSGGLSAHAWVRVDCPDEKTYSEVAKRILDALSPFGVDRANKNPSRLSRLAGAIRKIGAAGDGEQRLLWLNPKSSKLDLEAFEKSLQTPLIDDKPFKRVMQDALFRYDDLIANQGKLGVMTGIEDFDRDTGGFKGKQMTTIAAESNGGKSTMAINIANGALKHGHGVVLFTLEMDREEICDLLVSMNCGVNRNCFNTGRFSDEDSEKVRNQSGWMANMPLWIEDSASMTVEQIRARVEQLKAEKRIELVIVDYVQIITPSNPNEPREQQVANISRALRVMAKECNLPLIVLSQLNEDGKLRESRVIAHESHNVILLEADEDSNPPKMKMKVVKGRRIPKRHYELIYHPWHCRVFSEGVVANSDVPNDAQGALPV